MLTRALDRAVRRHGERAALITPAGWTVTFADLDRISGELAVGLAERGVKAGAPVVLVLPSSPEYVVAYLALARLGAVTAGISPFLGLAERQAMVSRAAATHVISTAALRVTDDATTSIIVEPADRLEGIFAELRVPQARPEPLSPDPERPVAVVFTSGTTGHPKAALFRNRQFEAALAVEHADPWAADEHILSSTQFAHVGFMMRLAAYLEQGTTLCMVDKWRAETALELIEQYRMPAVNGVSAQVALLLAHPDRSRRDLSSVQRVVVGGGPSAPALITQAIETWQASYSIRYSSTESGGVGTATSYDRPVTSGTSGVGHPRGDVQLRIVSDGQELPSGEIGEIQLRSSAMMSGYWRDPDATAQAIVDGWFLTGDLGYLDADGGLHLAGRTKEMYIRGGYNVYPQEAESLLASHPLVEAIAIVPRPDVVMGEIGVAVVRASGARPTLAELRAFGAEHLPGYKLPEVLWVVDDLPLTPSQKIDRRQLVELVADRHDEEDRLR